MCICIRIQCTYIYIRHNVIVRVNISFKSILYLQAFIYLFIFMTITNTFYQFYIFIFLTSRRHIIWHSGKLQKPELIYYYIIYWYTPALSYTSFSCVIMRRCIPLEGNDERICIKIKGRASCRLLLGFAYAYSKT